ncbi:MAG TPA: hypothetical protein PKI71_05640 [Candidatus Rifleibacterium sp.]|nr:hypothetical protein [Candidatus Rifleibacterium sp.]
MKNRPAGQSAIADAGANLKPLVADILRRKNSDYEAAGVRKINGYKIAAVRKTIGMGWTLKKILSVIPVITGAEVAQAFFIGADSGQIEQKKLFDQFSAGFLHRRVRQGKLFFGKKIG